MITYLIPGDSEQFGLRSVLALLVGAVVFTTLNLFMLTLILLAAEGVPPRELLEEQWALSLGMAVGSVGVATVALSIEQSNPALTPFAALPVIALWYAYRASSAHAEGRERSRWLVELGGGGYPGQPQVVIPRAAEALRRCTPPTSMPSCSPPATISAPILRGCRRPSAPAGPNPGGR